MIHEIVLAMSLFACFRIFDNQAPAVITIKAAFKYLRAVENSDYVLLLLTSKKAITIHHSKSR